MKAKVLTKDLKTALRLHKEVVCKKGGILEGIELIANGKLRLHSDNLETMLFNSMDANIQERGKCVIPFTVLEKVVNVCDDAFINIETQPENKTKIDKMLINCLPASEYPGLPDFKTEDCKIIEGLDYKEFINSLSKLKNFVSNEEERPLLTGFNLDTDKNFIGATDGYRMRIVGFNFGSRTGNFTISNIYKLLSLINGNKFDIVLSEDTVLFKIDDVYLSSRLLIGKYPDCMRLMKGNFKSKYEVETEPVIKAIDKSGKLITDKKTPAILNFINNKLTITKTDRFIGTYEETLEIKGKELLNIAFNPAFLKDCLNGYKTARLEVIDNLKPVKITGNDKDLITLLMPLRI